MTIESDSITGEHDLKNRKSIIYPFDRYEIEVELSSDGKFIGISEIKLNKSFLTHLQKKASFKLLDVDKYYGEADIE
jgi:hypothetical protein